MPHRRGYTLLEVTIVSGLMTAMAVLAASVWSGVGRTATDLVARSQLVQERDLAVMALCRDLGGSVGGPDRSGDENVGRWLDWEAPANAEQPANTDLRLLYDGTGEGDQSWTVPNTIIKYAVEASTLVRWDELANEKFTVAKHVESLNVTPVDGRPEAFNVVLCFKYRTRTLTCDLTVEIP